MDNLLGPCKLPALSQWFPSNRSHSQTCPPQRNIQPKQLGQRNLTLFAERICLKNPPKDHSAYPALKAAIAPHVESFNAVFEKDGNLQQGLLDIGSKVYLDGDDHDPDTPRNKLSIKIKEIILDKSVLPASNKFSTTNRQILPAECRERHVTYKGKALARLEYQVNNEDPKEFIRDIGQFPIMLNGW